MTYDKLQLIFAYSSAVFICFIGMTMMFCALLYQTDRYNASAGTEYRRSMKVNQHSRERAALANLARERLGRSRREDRELRRQQARDKNR